MNLPNWHSKSEEDSVLQDYFPEFQMFYNCKVHYILN